MFEWNGAPIYQGGYFNNIALIIGAVWIVWDASRIMFWLALCANALAAFALYAPPHGEIMREAAYWIGCAALLVAFLPGARVFSPRRAESTAECV